MGIAKRNVEVNSTINVTPMADVMLVLLIIFMVVTPMLQKGVSVDMARANNPQRMPDADREDAALIAVMRDGSVFFDTDKVNPDQLPSIVQERLERRAQKIVYIKADARAKYGRVVEVVDNVRTAGVDQLGLLTEEREGPGAAGEEERKRAAETGGGN